MTAILIAALASVVLALISFAVMIRGAHRAAAAEHRHALDARMRRAMDERRAAEWGRWKRDLADQPARPKPSPPSFWDQVVGIPLDAWHAATTSAQLHALIRLRDHPWDDVT